ncbi:MAG: 16S rRNA (guanine(966)-N(2))-methyltransferase RsmD [Betaproteobacteria bacterium]|nr:16S rRNA (guanine(966)-N(2))-methyltransferase RsmD [Betaproteobacteria bacterium]MBU6511425.1 16S rRNA (guanine(966)-N(2))-methyltransferase RsmD [Betaproteobacteria bacterium]MDE1954664.1 16S rRNA (guanine(966)-N(2))-methyltransferase RsmD [Betaproteobacteria bacterium]MDE2153130.1 16S rRNA (guanine(966)-N(2))-methyltransferase RsmD [Betaproteobacteria bacterium]MDE2477642.1 16S rRNA (guanine(966)-N(2))-methyltransferase RsmD [Betaproteobacteria bacterium]
MKATPSPPRHPRAGPGSVRIIGGRLRGSKLRVPDLPGLRPTPDRVRETLFNWLGQDLQGLRCLDLYAGSGALGLEAASRGASRVDMVERHPALARALGEAAQRLGAQAVRVHAGDAEAFAAAQAPGSYDVVFVDPPFAQAGAHERALAQAARLLAGQGRVYLEAPDAASLGRWAAAGWEVLRSARAGQVHYALLRRDAGAAPTLDLGLDSNPRPGTGPRAAT